MSGCIGIGVLQVGERAKTSEEMDKAEAARLQALERQRKAKMSGDDLGDEGLKADEDLPAGGYARRRAKRQKMELEAANPVSGDQSCN